MRLEPELTQAKGASRVQSVFLVGGGTIGSSWATFFLSRGLGVTLFDPNSEALSSARVRIEQQLERLVAHGLIASLPQTSKLTLTDEIAAGSGSDFVQESGPERYDAKAAIFEQLDRKIAPEVPVCSSSSGLLISRLQAMCSHPERYLIAHPFNPPHLVPLVELVPGPKTDPQILTQVREAFSAWGKTPITLNKEVPGHVANRLAAALWREAIALVSQGVASVADVDRALSAGPGLRWSIMGAHLTYHLGGGSGGIRHFWQHLGPAFETYFADLDTATTLAPDSLARLEEGLEDVVGERSIEELAHWRDETLIRILGALGDSSKPDDEEGDQT